MNFSSRTSSMDVQRNLESVVEKRTKDTFGPPVGKKMLVFIDDMNMPIVIITILSAHLLSTYSIFHRFLKLSRTMLSNRFDCDIYLIIFFFTVKLHNTQLWIKKL